MKLLLIIFISFVFKISAQQISAVAFTDTSDYLIGDYINYNLKVEYDKNIKIEKPEILNKLSNVDVIREEPPVYKEENGKKVSIFRIIISRYDSSRVTIPAITINYRVGKDTLKKTAPVYNSDNQLVSDSTLKQVSSDSVSFTVHSMKVAKNEDIKDIKNPLTIPLNWKIISMWILIGLILIGIFIFLYRRYKKKKSGKVIEKKIIILPPHIAALKALDELEKKQLWQKGMIKEYHSEITEIIRKYFAEKFYLPALELTTSEALDALRKRNDAKNILEITSSFLNNADLVKFAKFQPFESVNEEMMQQAKEIVNKTSHSSVVENETEEVNV
ncbi:MAG: hypothetical protein ABI550_00620 [Ignavibacteriaceae bacterium]